MMWHNDMLRTHSMFHYSEIKNISEKMTKGTVLASIIAGAGTTGALWGIREMTRDEPSSDTEELQTLKSENQKLKDIANKKIQNAFSEHPGCDVPTDFCSTCPSNCTTVSEPSTKTSKDYLVNTSVGHRYWSLKKSGSDATGLSSPNGVRSEENCIYQCQQNPNCMAVVQSGPLCSHIHAAPDVNWRTGVRSMTDTFKSNSGFISGIPLNTSNADNENDCALNCINNKTCHLYNFNTSTKQCLEVAFSLQNDGNAIVPGTEKKPVSRKIRTIANANDMSVRPYWYKILPLKSDQCKEHCRVDEECTLALHLENQCFFKSSGPYQDSEPLCTVSKDYCFNYAGRKLSRDNGKTMIKINKGEYSESGGMLVSDVGEGHWLVQIVQGQEECKSLCDLHEACHYVKYNNKACALASFIEHPGVTMYVPY